MARPPYQRCYPVQDEEFRKQWALQKKIANGNKCQACGKRPDFRGLHVHHLIRFRRSDEAANLLLICANCHDLCHDGPGPKLTIAACCAIKRRVDPDEFNLARLEQLRGGPIPGWCDYPG